MNKEIKKYIDKFFEECERKEKRKKAKSKWNI